MRLDNVLSEALLDSVIDPEDLFENWIENDYDYTMEILKTIDESPADAEGVLQDLDQFPYLRNTLKTVIDDLLNTGRNLVAEAIK